MELQTLKDLVEATSALGAVKVRGLSDQERTLLRRYAGRSLSKTLVDPLREQIAAGLDPLGEAFSRIRSAEERRPMGATYTPSPIVRAMVTWATEQPKPARIVDPGVGSGRFILAAGRRFKTAQLVASEIDPLAALIARANIASSGMSDRATVFLRDYREKWLAPSTERTLFIGNPPYVRHHQIASRWKLWLQKTAREYNVEASTLAGLHVYFFLATLLHGRKDDIGVFITSAEWLDVNYGAVVRQLLLDGLGGTAVHVLEPTVVPFADAVTTGAITCFRLGYKPSSIRLRRVNAVEDLGKLDGGRPIARDRLAEANRWTPLTRISPKVPQGFVELGELCRVHRGAVTGKNKVWVTRADETELPEHVLFRSVTKARELFTAGHSLTDSSFLRVVIDLPADLDELNSDDRKAVTRFLRQAKLNGAADGYIARYRKVWWSVGLRQPAPILATYMARRPPAFVRNIAGARHINIAHGLYPREPFAAKVLDRLANALRDSITVAQGRTYAGGLTKFEPKEMERLPVPDMTLLMSDDSAAATPAPLVRRAV